MPESLFKNLSRHISLDEKEVEEITPAFKTKLLKKNAVLLQPGEICRNIYFVDQGCLRLFNTDANGFEHNIMFCPEGWWAADMASFSGQVPAFYHIAALEDSRIFYLSYSDLETLYVRIPKLERFFRILIQNGFSLYQFRINSNLANTAEERYEIFRKQYPGLEQRIAQKHIATYLGITPVFLSRIRKRLP